MRKNALLATFVLAAVALANGTEPGIEVLGIEVLGIEVLATSQSTSAPDGSYVEAVTIDPNGAEMVVCMAPVCPMTGHSMVQFPSNGPGNRIDLRGPNGQLLCSDYVDGAELD